MDSFPLNSAEMCHSHLHLFPDLVSPELSQGDVELPEVPSDKLPKVPEVSEKKPGWFCLKVTSDFDFMRPETPSVHLIPAVMAVVII